MTTVFFGGIPAGLTEETVRSDLDWIGSIDSVSMPSSKSIMFLIFQDPAAAQSCIDHIEKTCKGWYRGAQVSCKLAHPRKDKHEISESKIRREAWMKGYHDACRKIDGDLGPELPSFIERQRMQEKPDREMRN